MTDSHLLKSIEIRLLGTLRISIGKHPITQFEANTSRALLAYLVTHPDPQLREYLAQLLWANQENGLVNLRAALTRLRESIGDKDAEIPLLLAERQTIQVNPERSLWVDIFEFETVLEQVKKHRHRRLEGCPICISHLTHIGNLIQGEFLLDIYVNSLPFEEWLLAQREHYRRLSTQIFATLTNYHLNCGNYTEAEHYARRQLQLEPWRETAHQQLMRALFENGQRTVALAQFKVCQTVLETELGVKPMEQTMALYREIRDAPFKKTTSSLNFSQTGTLAQLHTNRFPNNLPPSKTTFFGRESEINRLIDKLVAPNNQLITITGPGGVGKTRLALATAKKLLPAFRDGIWFIPLADIPPAADANEAQNAILIQTASKLEISLDPRGEMFGQLVAHFRNRELLLVIDNLEHLLEGKNLITSWLESAPKLSVLITSREPLNFQREQVVQVTGLPIPSNTTLQEALASPTVQLFVDRANHGQKKIVLSMENLPALIAICQFLQGHPLALELIATWVPFMSLEQMLITLQQNPSALYGPEDIPVRHRNIDAVFMTSWKLLGLNEQKILAELSIFPSGFTHQAAETILSITKKQLDTLQRKSLVQVAEDGRYSLHVLLKQFARDKLIEWNTNALVSIQKNFCAFYLGLIQQLEPELFGATPYLTTLKIQVEWGNVQQAWQWAVDERMTELLSKSVDGLSRYYILAGLGHHSDVTFGYAVQKFTQHEALNEDELTLNIRLLIRQAYYYYLRQDLRMAWEWASQAVALANYLEMPQPHLLGEGYYMLGQVLHRDGFFRQAAEYYLLALDRARHFHEARLETRCLIKLDFALTQSTDYNLLALEKACLLNDAFFIYEATHQLGVSATFQGHYGIALSNFGTLLQTIGWLPKNHPAKSRLLGDLGEASRQLGDYPHALSYYQQALEIIHYRGDQASEVAVLDGLSRLYRCTGNYQEAEQTAKIGLAIAQEISNLGGQFIHNNNLGNTFIYTQAWEFARQAYEQALQIGLEIGNDATQMESYAGLAEATYFLHNIDTSRSYLEKVLNFLAQGILDNSSEPLLVYLKCFRVLDALQDPQASLILESAYSLLMAQAKMIENDNLRSLFLTEETTNKTILEYWKMRDLLQTGLIGS